MTRPMHSPRLLSSDPTRPAGSWPSGDNHGSATGRPVPTGAITTGPAPVPAPVPGDPPARARPASPNAAVDAGDPVPHRHTPPRQRVPGTPGPELRAVPTPATPAASVPSPSTPPSSGPTPPPGGEESGPWQLVRAAQAGDMRAFSELFERYYDVVFRYVLFRMNDRTLAEDITQETFLRALRRIGSVTYQGRDIGAWFVTIARNLIFDHVKSSRYRLESTTSDIVELSPTTHGPEQQVLDLATNEELLRCVRKLNADQQECISLRFLQGLSVAETAKIMDRNEGAVKALQHRAVRRLAQLLPEGLR
jgi:RNA polymerase sigma-70 factor (ECF subfamily)